MDVIGIIIYATDALHKIHPRIFMGKTRRLVSIVGCSDPNGKSVIDLNNFFHPAEYNPCNVGTEK